MKQFDRLLAQCRSWDDFWQRAIAIEGDQPRGELFERLTQIYLRTQPEYESRLKNVWNARTELPGMLTLTKHGEGPILSVHCERSVSVTPEMIEAGVKCLWDSGRLWSEAPGADDLLVEKMFRAVWSAQGVSGRSSE